MRNIVLPVVTVLAVIAGAAGLQLGETAIAQIDPLYFQGAAASPRDVTREARAPRPNAFAQASGWEEGYDARTADCGADCPALLVRQTRDSALSIPLYDYSDPTIEPRWEQANAEPAEEEPPTPRPPSQVERYLHYRVSADQAELRAAREIPPPQNGTPGL